MARADSDIFKNDTTKQNVTQFIFCVSPMDKNRTGARERATIAAQIKYNVNSCVYLVSDPHWLPRM